MKICLVTAFPPSRRGLNEYGYHIARELQRDPLLSVTILADELDSSEPDPSSTNQFLAWRGGGGSVPTTTGAGFLRPPAELEEFDVQRVWRFDSFSNPARLGRALREFKPDVVWFNLLFSTFGNRPLPAFSGLTIPMLARISGTYTHVTLHHLMENIDLADSNIRFPRAYRAAGHMATRLLLAANSISVLLPAYRRTLIKKYRGENVHFRAHGIMSARPEPPDYTSRGVPHHRVLAFGKWGTYKRLELLLDAFELVVRHMPNAKLVVAGSDHPMTPGYVESVARRYEGDPRIDFVGYVAEEDIPALFRSSSVLVMPYSSATGSSGVAHLAAEYGLPIICADIHDFHEMADDEGLGILFYETGNEGSLADQICGLLNSPEMMKEMSEQNFSAALRQTMPQIMRQYLRSFDLHQRASALEPISRFRRLPGWVPSRSAIFRAAAPRWVSWM